MGADLALSVSLTALSSVATPFSISILYGWMARVWSATHPALHLPVDGATILGLVLARAARLPVSASVTIAIEVGLQNVAIATFVALTLLHDPRMALPQAVCALVALGVGAVGRRWIRVESRSHAVSLQGAWLDSDYRRAW